VRLLIVGTYRDTELHHDHPLVELLADLRRHTGIERLSLSGFDQAAIADFVAQAAGHDLNDDDLTLVRAIHTETGGNPFFVREIFRHLTETEAIVERDGRMVTRLAVEELSIPEGVREVVGRRVSRLSPDAHPVLRAAAVVGTEFEPSLVARAAGVDDDVVVSALEEAISARLVSEVAGPEPRYRFAHALVRDTLYGQLSAARRVPLHRRVAEAIEELHAGALDDHLPALAHHWARGAAPASETTRAAGYAAQAGDRALRQLAHDEAAAYYEQALELRDLAGAPADGDHCELLISLGEAQRRAGDPTHRDTLLAAGRLAKQLAAPALQARAGLAARRGLFSRLGPIDWELVSALEMALDAVGGADSPERARLLAALATELHVARDRRPVEVAREGLAVARRLGDVTTLAETIEAVWMAERDPSAVADRRALADELTGIAHSSGDPVLCFRAAFVQFLTASEQGDVSAADRALAECRRLADDVGQPLLRWRAAYLQTHRAFMDGRLSDAERSADEALRLGHLAAQPDAGAFSDVYLIRLLQGRTDEAVELLTPLKELFGDVAAYPALSAWTHAEAGRTDQAEAFLTQARAAMSTGLHHNYLWLVTLVCIGRASALLGDISTAEEVYVRLQPHRSAIVIGQAVWFGPVAYDLGLLATALGRYAEADSHFAEAVQTHARSGTRGMLAHTYLAWGRMLVEHPQRGETIGAGECLALARDRAREQGLANIEREATALLEQLPSGTP
jgi:tetratricopeptide (TPR) repeat protein